MCWFMTAGRVWGWILAGWPQDVIIPQSCSSVFINSWLKSVCVCDYSSCTENGSLTAAQVTLWTDLQGSTGLIGLCN